MSDKLIICGAAALGAVIGALGHGCHRPSGPSVNGAIGGVAFGALAIGAAILYIRSNRTAGDERTEKKPKKKVAKKTAKKVAAKKTVKKSKKKVADDIDPIKEED
jgi:hypothetical protein